MRREVIAHYEEVLAARGFSADSAQRAAVERLQRMHDEFLAFKARRSSRIRRLISRPPVPRGVWLHGGVGRGKSFLMDCFYATIPVVRKTRVHFHEFMRGVHRELRELKGTQDPLDEVSRRVSRRYRLICFDEFHVSDIADAMILERLVRGLLEHGVTFVMTSNYAPESLYPDGLHRDRVLPAIAMLKSRLDVLSVDAGIDYRRRSMQQVKAYHHPIDEDSRAALQDAYAKLAETADDDPVMTIENRPVRALRRAGGVVWFDFATLCGGPRSQNDYLELARQFHTVILSDVPRMTPAMASEARRFVWLVDVFYDQRIKLLVSAQCEPESLYLEGAMSGEFHRTVSRLIEMQSREYLDAPRREPSVSIA
ncbi:MAG: cell division protein ZapE [Burkholderiaceae bacterium]|nr:cell division protein ZapE [Burkholderiaceae bacterium]